MILSRGAFQNHKPQKMKDHIQNLTKTNSKCVKTAKIQNRTLMDRHSIIYNLTNDL